MNYRSMLVSLVLLLTGCETPYTHFDLPDNNITFPAEGGTVEYAYPGLTLVGISVNGEKQIISPLCVDSRIIGEYSEWISLIDGWRIGNNGVYSIEVKANPSKQDRSAVLDFDLGKHYGEIFINQKGVNGR